MNSNIFNSIILSNEQVNYLMGGTAGINRLSCLYQLIQMVTRQIETSNEVGESTTALWEVNMSEVALSKLWKCDRKTVSKMLDHEQIGHPFFCTDKTRKCSHIAMHFCMDC